jgi:hypothetical protein
MDLKHTLCQPPSSSPPPHTSPRAEARIEPVAVLTTEDFVNELAKSVAVKRKKKQKNKKKKKNGGRR